MRPLPIVLVLLAAAASALAAQQTSRGLAEPEASLERAEELHYRMRPRDAMDTLKAAVDRHPDDPRILEAAAREALDLGILTSDDEQAERWFGQAEEYARRAVAADSASLEARYWLSAALGRKALLEGARTRVRLAGEIRDLADWILARDSTHAGAHHVLGMWHAEIRSLRSVTRFFAEHLLGGDEFDDASWDAAIRHLERAVELDPDMLLFRLDLARVTAQRDRREDARAQLREILERPSIHPIDPRMKQEAQELLKSMQ